MGSVGCFGQIENIKRQSLVYKPLTKNEMLEVIGANLEGNPDLQNDIRELAGQQVSEEDFSQYLDKGNGSKETMDFSIYKTDKKK